MKWILLLIAFALFIPLSGPLDLAITSWAYAHGNDPVHHFFTSPWITFVYQYGPLPANILGGAALVFLVLSYLFSKFRRFREPCLVLFLTWSIGAGLLINTVLKDHWGRPRPKQVEEFGGTLAFRPFWKPNFLEKNEPAKSFPSGHAAMGFYFISLAIVFQRQRNKTLTILSFLLALSLGILLSTVRILQGGHFFSDTLFSLFIIWGVARLFDHLVYKGEPLP